jgi:hypothetical protein
MVTSGEGNRTKVGRRIRTTFYVGSVSYSSTEKINKYGTPTRCNNNSFIDLQDQLNIFRANLCPSSGAQN